MAQVEARDENVAEEDGCEGKGKKENGAKVMVVEWNGGGVRDDLCGLTKDR